MARHVPPTPSWRSKIDDVVDAGLREAVGDRQPAEAGADDGDLDPVGHAALLRADDPVEVRRGGGVDQLDDDAVGVDHGRHGHPARLDPARLAAEAQRPEAVEGGVEPGHQ